MRKETGKGGMAGYSGKPLFEKLGFKTDMQVLVLNAPRAYGDIIGRDVTGFIHVAQFTFLQKGTSKIDSQYDCIHLFVTELRDLEKFAKEFKAYLADSGMLWISWPKKSAHVPTDITEQTLRDVLLPLGVVDVKVCAVDELWSGLKFVRRKS